MILPNYEECITNISCSILKYYNCPYNHNTIKELDNILNENKPKNVVLILYDGMGHNIINRTLDKNDFLIKNEIKAITSVCPATTTAATTSLLSGLNPNEHGWLGWDVYVKPINQVITLFKNAIKDSYKVMSYDIAHKYFSYESIKDKIKDKTDVTMLYPFGKDKYKNIDEMNNLIINACQKDNNQFIYAYCDEPDNSEHEYGTDSNDAINIIKMINNKTEELCNQLNDTVIIVIADHGHINCEDITLSNYIDIFNTLDGDISIEGRLCSFKVKDGMDNEFITLFNKYFKNDFILKSYDEVIKMNLFGIGKDHKLFKESLGNYIALGIGNKYFRYNDNSVKLKSMHAGLTEDEMLIPLIVKVK